MKGRILLVVLLTIVLVSTLTRGARVIRTNEKLQKTNKTGRDKERLVTPLERNKSNQISRIETKNKTTTQRKTNNKGNNFSLPSLPFLGYLPQVLLFIFGVVIGWVGHLLKIKREKSKSKERIDL